MAAMCLPCAVHVWLRDSRRALVLVGINSVGMVTAHVALLTLMPGDPAAAHADHQQHVMSSHGHARLVTLTLLEACVAAATAAATHRLASKDGPRNAEPCGHRQAGPTGWAKLQEKP